MVLFRACLCPARGEGGGCTAERCSLFNIQAVLIILHFPAMNHGDNLMVRAAKRECFFVWDPSAEPGLDR